LQNSSRQLWIAEQSGGNAVGKRKRASPNKESSPEKNMNRPTYQACIYSLVNQYLKCKFFARFLQVFLPAGIRAKKTAAPKEPLFQGQVCSIIQ